MMVKILEIILVCMCALVSFLSLALALKSRHDYAKRLEEKDREDSAILFEALTNEKLEDVRDDEC